LTRLRISDRGDSGNEYNSNANDSGCEIDDDGDDDDDDDDDEGNMLFLSSARMKNKVIAGRTTAGRVPAAKERDKEEVAEVISPGGHVTKRRARSRPVSAELKQSVRLPKSPVRVS
jgi:mitosis inhibitor protein kinase SWE1